MEFVSPKNWRSWERLAKGTKGGQVLEVVYGVRSESSAGEPHEPVECTEHIFHAKEPQCHRRKKGNAKNNRGRSTLANRKSGKQIPPPASSSNQEPKIPNASEIKFPMLNKTGGANQEYLEYRLFVADVSQYLHSEMRGAESVAYHVAVKIMFRIYNSVLSFRLGTKCLILLSFDVYEDTGDGPVFFISTKWQSTPSAQKTRFQEAVICELRRLLDGNGYPTIITSGFPKANIITLGEINPELVRLITQSSNLSADQNTINNVVRMSPFISTVHIASADVDFTIGMMLNFKSLKNLQIVRLHPYFDRCWNIAEICLRLEKIPTMNQDSMSAAVFLLLMGVSDEHRPLPPFTFLLPYVVISQGVPIAGVTEGECKKLHDDFKKAVMQVKESITEMDESGKLGICQRAAMNFFASFALHRYIDDDSYRAELSLATYEEIAAAFSLPSVIEVLTYIEEVNVVFQRRHTVVADENRTASDKDDAELKNGSIKRKAAHGLDQGPGSGLDSRGPPVKKLRCKADPGKKKPSER